MRAFYSPEGSRYHRENGYPRPPVNTFWDDQFFAESIAGKTFKNKRGSAIWRAEKIWHDRSYERYYGFVHTYYKLRNVKTGRTKNVTSSEFKSVYEPT